MKRIRCIDCKKLLVSSIIKKEKSGLRIERAAYKCTSKPEDKLWFKMITETMKLRDCPDYEEGEHIVEWKQVGVKK